jgi:hypothetical protein
MRSTVVAVFTRLWNFGVPHHNVLFQPAVISPTDSVLRDIAFGKAEFISFFGLED